ncbi:ABC transporter ATP-binding protein [Pseudonocardia parietis]|uniref:Branched-chain amino acid transport system ATP-binding protein n=1 Tax=Pseudonocardia parietis TaxID=570936 RepID=A0ABS4VL35_9PSEU|nr:ABC transporter ATP-binding protein [Pseudonocardia parietis]MBP2364635.1 branched-chain amino acid transport system ATP-binding protein [Pseudonocardia parietis]
MTDVVVEALTAGYDRSTVLDGVDLSIGTGGALGLLGRNGVGKSTLIMSLMGIVAPTSGRVLLDGQDVAGRRPDLIARAGVALVPQGRRIWAPLTVAETLALAGRGHGRRWTTDAVLDLLPRLRERLGQQAGQLSGGEQQMLAIARALLTDPTVLLLDEPSDGLAPAIVDQIAELLTTLRGEGVTMLLVEQDLHLAFTVCDEIAVMEKGRIVHLTGTPEFRADRATAHRLLGVA